jgi:hypothetical protein
MKYNNQSIKMYGVILILILGIVAVSTNYWSTSTVSISDNEGDSLKMTGEVGLWKSCTKGSANIPDINVQGINIDTANCTDSSDPSVGLKNLKTVRILSISSLVLIALSLYLLYAMPKQKEYFILCLVLAGILSVISVILWNNDPGLKEPSGNAKHGYSWYLELISGLLAVLLAGLTQFNVIA